MYTHVHTRIQRTIRSPFYTQIVTYRPGQLQGESSRAHHNRVLGLQRTHTLLVVAEIYAKCNQRKGTENEVNTLSATLEVSTQHEKAKLIITERS